MLNTSTYHMCGTSRNKKLQWSVTQPLMLSKLNRSVKSPTAMFTCKTMPMFSLSMYSQGCCCQIWAITFLAIIDFLLLTMPPLVCIQASDTGKCVFTHWTLHAFCMKLHMNSHPWLGNSSVVTVNAAHFVSTVLVSNVTAVFSQVIELGFTM